MCGEEEEEGGGGEGEGGGGGSFLPPRLPRVIPFFFSSSFSFST